MITQTLPFRVPIVLSIVLLLGAARSWAGPREDIRPDVILSGHTDGVTGLAFSPDGKLLASCSLDRTIRIWDTSNSKLLRTLSGHTEKIYAVDFSPDGKSIASCSKDVTVRVWDASTGDQVAQLEGHTYNVRGVAFLPDGTLLSGGPDGLRLWNTKTEKLLWRSQTDPPSAIGAMSVSADGKYCAYINQDGTTILWDLAAR